MKVMITGASGFIGAYVMREAMTRGHRVVALCRSRPSEPSGNASAFEWIQCDLRDTGPPGLSGMGIDAVVHLAAGLSGSFEEQHRATVVATANLLDAMRRAGIRKLVGVSSIAVLDYASLPAFARINENMATPAQSSGMGIYATMKLEQERLFTMFAAEPGNCGVTIRPGLVYDDKRLIGAHAGIVKGPLNLISAHGGEIPVVEVTGVARAIIAACERDAACGEVIHLVDDHLPGQAEYVAGLQRRGLMRTGGARVPWRLLSVSISVLRTIFRAAGLGKKLPEVFLRQGFAARLKPFRFSNDKARRMLDWTPARSFS